MRKQAIKKFYIIFRGELAGYYSPVEAEVQKDAEIYARAFWEGDAVLKVVSSNQFWQMTRSKSALKNPLKKLTNSDTRCTIHLSN